MLVRHFLLDQIEPYLSNTPTNLCMRLLNFSWFCFVLYCYAFVQYCNVKTIQYNAMHKFVGVLDNPPNRTKRLFWKSTWRDLSHLIVSFNGCFCSFCLGFKAGRRIGTKMEGCPILRQIYAWHCIVLSSHYNTVQKHNNKERSKTMRNLTNACINLSEYWTSMPFTVLTGVWL